ncbi:Conserved hypothetical protein [Shewanella piezotolerans WP3]|uniref:Uncharacterized protein n=2 Tax=Shewanella TaxID=22 RepID=B8CV56_SHEPW|nr:Conserved hypothetical protein [Shewanella piezotolerans WP3]
MVHMKTDIYQKIELDFGADLPLAIEQLEIVDARTKGMIGDRMIRAMVFLSKGNMDRFKQVIELAHTDYRDVLWQAEYDCGEEQLYDFNKTFHELKLMGK